MMMHLSTELSIAVRRTDGLLEIALDRPGKANALTASMMRHLEETIADARADEVVVLQSTSPHLFCAGADIREFVDGELPQQEVALLALIGTLARSRAPIIAIARGRASGAGAILLALADVVVAADDLCVACPEFVFGMYPVIVEAVLQSRLPLAVAAQLCVGARELAARQALDFGLATEVLSVDGFADAARARVVHYVERRAGLAAMRRARNMSLATDSLGKQLETVAPLMLENFDAPGVAARIQQYLGGLSKR